MNQINKMNQLSEKKEDLNEESNNDQTQNKRNDTNLETANSKVKQSKTPEQRVPNYHSKEKKEGIELSLFGTVWATLSNWVTHSTFSFLYSLPPQGSQTSLSVSSDDNDVPTEKFALLTLTPTTTTKLSLLSTNVARLLPHVLREVNVKNRPHMEKEIEHLIRTFNFSRPFCSFSTEHWLIFILVFLNLLRTRNSELNKILSCQKRQCKSQKQQQDPSTHPGKEQELNGEKLTQLTQSDGSWEIKCGTDCYSTAVFHFLKQFQISSDLFQTLIQIFALPSVG